MVGAMLGAILGSFLATLVIRWPEIHSVLTGRSRCDHCHAELRARQLIALISYFLQRGRARCCGQPIDPLHPAAEALSFTIGMMSFGFLGWEGYASALLGWMLLGLALFDKRYFLLPDWLNGALLFTGLVLPMPDGAPPITDRLIGTIIGYASLTLIALLYRKFRHREGLGGGDAKLLAAVGAWVGWQSLPMILVTAATLGLVVAAILKVAGFQVNAGTRLPLGTVIAAAAWPIWLQLQIAM